GIVDEYVEAAEPRHGKSNQRAADLLARQVAVEVLRIAARLLDAPNGLEAVGTVASVHHDIRPEPPEMLRDAAADAGRRSGHDRHFAGEVRHDHPAPSSTCRANSVTTNSR